MMRWLYHARPRGQAGFDDRAGFVHCSFANEISRSIVLHMPGVADVEILKIDPRRLDVPVDVADTPRGPMPHVHGAIPDDAIRSTHAPGETLEDEVRGTRFCFFAFDGMTLLDLVGVHDPIARIASMGFDETSTRIIAGPAERVWSKDGMTITVDAVLPPLDDVDVLVLAGGPQTRALQERRARARLDPPLPAEPPPRDGLHRLAPRRRGRPPHRAAGPPRTTVRATISRPTAWMW